MNRITTTLLLSTLCFACSGPTGRVMNESEEDYVGNRAAGAETYDRLIEGAVQKMLGLHSASLNRGGEKLKVAVLAVENASGEELGDWHEQVYELIDTSINRSDRYRTVSRRFVDAALRETRMTNEQLFLAKNRRDFVAVLEQNEPVHCLMFPKLTRGTTAAGGGVAQKNYMLTLELVDLKTGFNDKVSERLRKEYTQ
jgi:hypothetical protein